MLRTPADLRAMRLRLGLQESQMTALLGLGENPVILRKLETGRQLGVWQGHVDVLRAIDEAFAVALDAVLDGPELPVLIAYPNDEVFAAHEPGLVAGLRFATVHRMVLAVAQEMLRADGLDISIVELVPADYEHWLQAAGIEHSVDAVLGWGVNRLTAFRTKEGFPRS